MEIMKINKTLYFSDSGELYDTFKEAKENSDYEDLAYFIRKQKVKVYKENELPYRDIEESFKYHVYSMKNNFLFATDDKLIFLGAEKTMVGSQLWELYNNGLISEQTFIREMQELENNLKEQIKEKENENI